MPITVHIPSALRPICGGRPELRVSALTVGDALRQLEQDFPEIYRSVCDETGRVRRHVNVFVNSSLVLGDEGFDTPLQDNDVLTIMPAVSGG